jgi:hypothetical protein
MRVRLLLSELAEKELGSQGLEGIFAALTGEGEEASTLAAMALANFASKGKDECCASLRCERCGWVMAVAVSGGVR